MKTLFPASRLQLQSFDLEGVTLSPSRLQTQYQHTRDYFLSIPNDDILFGFRQRACLPSPGKAMGGWYSGDDRGLWYSGGHCAPNFGQWLSGFARMAKTGQDAPMRDKVLDLMRKWAVTITPDGYCGALSRDGHTAVDHYFYDKLVCGLVDIAHYLGNEEALELLKTVTSWAVKNLSNRRIPAHPYNPSGESHGSLSELEWYTLSENLYRAFLLTGNETYSNFARVWHYETFWRDLANGKDAFPGKHAYSHVNALSSAALAYAVTGEQVYMDAMIHGYDILQNNHLYAIGGYGNQETFLPAEGYLRASLWNNQNAWGTPSNFEATCGSWAVFKVCRYLMEFTGSARYGDWAELMLYNGIGAALPMGGYGKTFYYADYKVTGASKQYYPELWPCCAGTYPQAVNEYHNLIYFHSPDGLSVNLFVPSRVAWEAQGQPVEVVQETSFPESGEISLCIHTSKPVQFALRIRIPGWVKGTPVLKINQALQPVSFQAGEWLTIDRVWREQDAVQLSLPLDLRFSAIDGFDKHRAALMAGPVVLVADQIETLTGDPHCPEDWIQPGDAQLCYQADAGKTRVNFHPYYSIPEGINYFMYLLLEHSL